MRAVIFIIGICTFSLAPLRPARAQTPASPGAADSSASMKNFSIEGNLGYNGCKGDDDYCDGIWGGVTAGFKGLYRLNQVFSVGFSWQYFKMWGDRTEDYMGNGVKIDLEGSAWAAGFEVRFHFPISSEFRPYVFAGLGVGDGDVEATASSYDISEKHSDDNSYLVMGVGVEKSIGPQLHAGVAFSFYKNDWDDFDSLDYFVLAGTIRYTFK
ncbi:porin family protein [Myxococcota bacterium]|nr:porin family protein [Myxococcota bacterium]MBU1536634.1 porin family protein [Myxococcota bacterium]